MVIILKTRKTIFDYFLKFNDSVTSNPLLLAVRNGFTYMIPLVLIGSFALVLLSLPINGYQRLMTDIFGDSWKNILLYIRDGTFNSFSLIAVICISYSYTREINEYKDYVSPIIASVTSLASFVALSGIYKESFSLQHFGVIGIFIALLVALLSSEMFRRLTAVRIFKVRMFTDGANPNFNTAISLFVPAAVTVTVFALVNEGLAYLFNISNIQTFISDSLLRLFNHVNSDFGRGLLFILLIHVFWIFGIHGSNTLESVAQGIFVPALEINQNLAAAALQPTEVFTKTFFDTFVLMGGCGSMICLILAILLSGGIKSQSRLAKLSIIPVLFNINELMVFGIPVVLNPVFVIPFLCVPVIMTVLSYLVMQLGLVPMTIHQVEWTTPIFLSGYISTGSVAGSLLQLVNLAIGTLCYMPFVRLSEKSNQAQKNTNLNKIIDAFTQSEEHGMRSSLLSRHDSVGSIARSLTADLENDLANSAIGLYYQPIVDKNEKVVRLEALLRWKHKSYGFIYPPLIIALAEEANLMNRLGDWILDRACGDLDAYKKAGFEDLTVCVNISAVQLEDDHFIDALSRTLGRYQLNPSNFEIEITESLALRVNRKIKGLIDTINTLGVKLSMDDFGMGHSSLMYLKEYNFDTVKLDGSLVRELLRNKSCENIISSIVALGKTLGYEVVAEFVETAEQRELLLELGCDLFQGYLYSKAIPAGDAVRFMQSRRGLSQPVRR
jgi:lactose/cellobiose-specific phosphotransferase system IIC component